MNVNNEKHHPKVLMHIECLRGTGELTLANRVAQAMIKRGMDVVVTTGNDRDFFTESEHLKLYKLPTIRYDDKKKKAYLTEDGALLSESKEWAAARTAKLREIVDHETPDAMMVCYWPFGNGRDAHGSSILDNELAPLVQHLRKTRAHMPIFGSIREVLHVDSQPYEGGSASAANFINQNFEKLFVHGDPALLPLTDTFDYARHIDPGKLEYTGYLCEPPTEDKVAKDTVIIAAGGGDYRPSVGITLEKSITALKDIDSAFLKGKKVRVLVSTGCDEQEYSYLQRLGKETASELKDVTIEVGHSLPPSKYWPLLNHCAMFIGQAGIASMLDSFHHQFLTMVVPIDEKSSNGTYHFQEQAVRARKLEEKGVVQMIEQHELNAAGGEKVMAKRINAEIARRRQGVERVQILCDGARHTADSVYNAIEAAQTVSHQKRAAQVTAGSQDNYLS